MKYHNIAVEVSNYLTSNLDKKLSDYGNLGYKLVSTNMVKNEFDCTVMYLFFTKEINEGELK